MADDTAPASAPWRPILLMVIAIPLLLGLLQLGRSGGIGVGVGDGFDWAPYPSSIHDAVEHASRNADCSGLAEQRAWATSPAASGIDTGPLVEHIDSIRRMLACVD